jgi:hypothetical protein
MARSSKPRRSYSDRPRSKPFQLLLTRGGQAELIDPQGEIVWASSDDPDFLEDYPDFLTQGDLEDILQFLVDVGELTDDEADAVDPQEEFLEPSDLRGSFPAE